SFVSHGGGSIATNVTGRFSPSGEAIPSVPSTEASHDKLRVGGLEFGLTSDMELSFRYAASVCTPRISATGIGSARCEWRFDKDKEPLFGRDLETWAGVVLPSGQSEIGYRLKYYVITRTFFFPTRRQSQWSDPISCRLVANQVGSTLGL